MKHTIKQNRWDNWYGYTGGRRVIAFGTDAQGTAEQYAQAWLETTYNAHVASTYGPDLARLARGFNRTTLEVTTTDAHLAAALVRAAENRQLPVLTSMVDIGRAKRVPHLRVTIRASAHDIEVAGSGESVLLIHGTSPEGVDWLHANVQHEPWQQLAGRLGVEHRFIASIIEGATAAGLSVRVL